MQLIKLITYNLISSRDFSRHYISPNLCDEYTKQRSIFCVKNAGQTRVWCVSRDIFSINNYASIDPKQFQNDSFGPILVKNDFFVRPTFLPPKSKLLYQWFLSASRSLIVRPQQKTREKQDKRRTRPGHRVQGHGQSVFPALFPKIEPQQ